MAAIDYRSRYIEAVGRLMDNPNRHEAMGLAVGGDYEYIGTIMRELLIAAGLRPNDYLIDVGCGSGRLAVALKRYLTGRYLGFDVVPQLLEYARESAAQPDWRFEESDGRPRIPEADNTADMVCFFSVLTHLEHEDSFLYLADAKRVLQSGGTIVFSFLDFSIPSHWNVFDGMLEARARGEQTHHNQFMAREMIQPWADRLGLEVVAVIDGNAPQLQLDADIALSDGRVVPRDASLGQSVCVLRKGLTTAHAAESAPGQRSAPGLDLLRLAALEERATQHDTTLSWLENELGPLLHSRTWRTLCRLASWLHKTFRSPRPN
jgi:SAM-dependent methyltransferase